MSNAPHEVVRSWRSIVGRSEKQIDPSIHVSPYLQSAFGLSYFQGFSKEVLLKVTMVNKKGRISPNSIFFESRFTCFDASPQVSQRQNFQVYISPRIHPTVFCRHLPHSLRPSTCCIEAQHRGKIAVEKCRGFCNSSNFAKIPHSRGSAA